MAAPTLPEEAQSESDEVAMTYSFYIHTQRYEEAFEKVKELYEKMVGWQDKYGMRLHKGYPLHNMGYALHLQGKHKQALYYFVLAYIEDLLSADHADEADLTPAGRTLLQGYKYAPQFLQLLKNNVTELKKVGESPRNPQKVLAGVPEAPPPRKDILGKITVHRPRKLLDFKSSLDKRVFVGGSGGLTRDFNTMRRIVHKLGFDPVLAFEFETPEGMTIYRKCLLLLHSCKHAIFDLTEQKGQLLEVERAPDYGVKTLLISQGGKEHSITQMLRDPTLTFQERGFGYKPYNDDNQLERIIKDFLAQC